MIPAGLIPESYKWCVAGGFAACPALARDIDVWVYGIAPEQVETTQQQLQHQIATGPCGHGFASSDERLSSSSYSQEFIQILKVGDVHWNGNRKHHVIVTDANSPESILDGFDLSTHAVAIMPDGKVVTHPLWTAPHVLPQVMRSDANTPARLVRVAARFGHPITVKSVHNTNELADAPPF